MIAYIALCDKCEVIKRVIHSVPIDIIDEGKDAKHLLENKEELGALLCEQLGCENSLRLPIETEGNPLVYVTVRSIDSQLLFLAYDVGDSRLSRFAELALSALETIRGTTGQENCGAGYYEVQKLNSQLINCQRTQAKTYTQLQKLLDKTWKAEGTIEMPGRGILIGLYTGRTSCDRTVTALRTRL